MIGPGDPVPDAADAGAGGPRVVDVSGLPVRVADAVVALVEHHATTASTLTDAAAGTAPSPAAAAVGLEADSEQVRERLGDVIQAAEAVKGFADACALDAAGALVTDVTAGHGIAADDPRYARKVAAHHKAACRAVVHEVQLLTGSTLTAARTRVRFATALPERVHGAHALLRSGACCWDRAPRCSRDELTSFDRAPGRHRTRPPRGVTGSAPTRSIE